MLCLTYSTIFGLQARDGSFKVTQFSLPSSLPGAFLIFFYKFYLIMNTYKPETLVVVAQELVNQGGYKGNPLMDHPQVRQIGRAHV